MTVRSPDAPLLEARRLLSQHLAAWFDADPGATVRSGASAFGEAGLPRQSKSHVGNLVQGDTDATADEVAVLIRHLSPNAIATGAARLAGGTFVPGGSVGAIGRVRRGLLIGALTGELLAAIERAADDGEIDDDEVEAMRPQIEAQVAHLQGLLQRATPAGARVEDEAGRRQTRGRVA